MDRCCSYITTGGLLDFTTKGFIETGSLAGDALLVNIGAMFLPDAYIFYFNLLAIS